MRIISQNKRILVECNLVVITKTIEECYYVKAIDPEDRTKLDVVLGKYSSLLKAKKVLAELEKDALSMPEDDEVEVSDND